MSVEIDHIIPQIGLVRIPLYDPAEQIYNRLVAAGEVTRLNKLRHLGALSSSALVGARLARWDYTAALLHYSHELKLQRFNSGFKIGTVKFSSTTSALQCASLIWNIGHLPGTFSIEKGVCRYLKEKGPRGPSDLLDWPYKNHTEVIRIKKEANSAIINDDYFAVCRVLAVIKLLSLCVNDEDPLFKFTVDFAAPLLLKYERHYSKQWSKITKSFSIIRHLAYLTLDLPFSGNSWAPNIPELLRSQININNKDLDLIHGKISELLSPIEKSIYDTMYHSDNCRLETATFAELTNLRLNNVSDATAEIKKWLTAGLTRELGLGRKPKANKIQRCLQIKLRDHFSSHPDSCSEIELKLKNKKFTHSTVFQYLSWNSDALLEPDELIIDVLMDKTPTSSDIGKVIYWFISEFDNFSAKHDDSFEFLRKKAIDASYTQIFSKAVEKYYPRVTVRIEPWRLSRFGLFPKFTLHENQGAIWAASGKLDDDLIGHILRDKSASITPELKEQYLELLGIKALRNELRREWGRKTPKCRWLVLTSSVTFLRDGKDLIEYDGGLLKISARSGALTWYGLETKNGRENPTSSLKKRLDTLAIKGEVKSIDSRFAYVKIKM